MFSLKGNLLLTCTTAITRVYLAERLSKHHCVAAILSSRHLSQAMRAMQRYNIARFHIRVDAVVLTAGCCSSPQYTFFFFFFLPSHLFPAFEGRLATPGILSEQLNRGHITTLRGFFVLIKLHNMWDKYGNRLGVGGPPSPRLPTGGPAVLPPPQADSM